MELGNMFFGNSRGVYEVPRDEVVLNLWERFTDAAEISWRGYSETDNHPLENSDGCIETEAFLVRPYDWNAECDCGFDETIDAWWERNPHGQDCYGEELRRRKLATGLYELDATFGGVTAIKGVPYNADEPIRKKLCEERGLSFPMGSAVHCDCGVKERAVAELGAADHSPTCRFVLPNFLFKPTGFSVQWYKYPFRDSYASEPFDLKKWRAMMSECMASAKSGAA